MEIKKSFWKIGKEDSKKFNNISLGRKTGTVTFLLGILFIQALTATIIIHLKIYL